MLICPAKNGDMVLFNAYGMQGIDYAELVRNFVAQENIIPEPRITGVRIKILEDMQDIDLHPNMAECYLISSRVDVVPGSDMICNFGSNTTGCSRCGKMFDSEGAGDWKINKRPPFALCPKCRSAGYECGKCGEYAFDKDTKAHIVDGRTKMFHKKCYEDLEECKCGRKTARPVNAIIAGENTVVCGKCVRHLNECYGCGAYTDEITIIDDHRYCAECAKVVRPCEVCGHNGRDVEMRADGVMACNGDTWYCEWGGHKEQVRVSIETSPAQFPDGTVKPRDQEYLCPDCLKQGRRR